MKQFLIRYILPAFFTLLSWAGHSQEPSDKEIRFDRAEVRREIYENNPGGDPKLLDQQIEGIRTKLLLAYKDRVRYFGPVQPIDVILPVREYDGFSGCASSNFNAKTPLSAWRLSNNLTPFDYNDSYDEQVTNGFTGTVFNSGTALNDLERFAIQQGEYLDPYLAAVAVSNPGIKTTIPTNFVRVGNKRNYVGKEMISRSFTMQSDNDVIFYDFAIVLEDPGHVLEPFFRISLRINGVLKPCSIINYTASAASTASSFLDAGSNIYVRPWSSNVIKPADFGANTGDTVTIEVAVSDCQYNGGHFGYGYFDIQCVNEDSVIVLDDGPKCIGVPIRLRSGVELAQPGYKWKIYNSSNVLITQTSTAEPEYTFTQPGDYTIQLEIPYFTTTMQLPACNTISVFKKQITVGRCEEEPCIYCASFNPAKGEKYIIEGWVKEKTTGNGEVQVKTYDKPFIKVVFTNTSQAVIGSHSYYAAGDIIDGWQRISGEFIIPEDIDDLHIELQNGGSANVSYFDDIRVYPFNGTMRSFVYNMETQLLEAELDENNYATFYEYDAEGQLVRVKRETESGRRTIEEHRSSKAKKSQ